MAGLIYSELFERILVAPAKAGATGLSVVTGYASPALAHVHRTRLREIGRQVDIELTIGMGVLSGVSRVSFEGFRALASQTGSNLLSCRFVVTPPPVHTKAYLWKKGTEPIAAFVGSANYSTPAFNDYREAMIEADPKSVAKYVGSLESDSMDCHDPEILKLLRFVEPFGPSTRKKVTGATAARLATLLKAGDVNTVEISLLDRDGKLPTRSGLNWGQRPEYRRNPNQAYIRVPSSIARSGFFPPRGGHFTVFTDDGESFVAVVAQDGDKAIETPYDNSLLGRYFRKRLGLADGAPVTLSDLQGYGRTQIDFVKCGQDEYFMEFGNRNG